METPSPLTGTLPSLLREDAFARQLCDGLDIVLAPVLLSLDSFPAYLDVGTTPEDMLPWLAQWVGLGVDPAQDAAEQRELLRTARDLHAFQGTRRGIQLAVKAALGIEVDVVETGAASWSTRADADLPGEPGPAVVVTARPESDREVDIDRFDAVVRAVSPGHVRCRVQVAG